VMELDSHIYVDINIEDVPLVVHTAAFVHVLVLLAASLALCYGESINLT
jgi:hypothetical protein